MRKHFLFIILFLIVANTINAQTKGNKVGYIDMEYILQNVPNYIEAKAQLEEKAQKWKQEIEAKKIEINKLNDALKAEKPLLTQELIQERETEIQFLENEKLDYQQKRFGPNGDLMVQKSGLVKPIQDQIFTVVQDIAEAKKYDFIFDKSSHLTILFAAKRFDISDQVIRVLNRTEKKEHLTKKQQKEEDEKESKQDAIDENPVLAEKDKALQDKKTAREQLIETKRLAQEETRRLYEEKRKQLLAEREAKKKGTVVAKTTESATTNTVAEKGTEELKPSPQEEQKKLLEEKRKKTLEDREAAKKALEEKRIKELADREAQKNAKTATTTKTDNSTSKTSETPVKFVPNTTEEKTTTEADKTTEEAKPNLQEERKKALEEKRKKILEERAATKKALEEKKAKELEEKAALKKANEEKLKENNNTNTN